MTVSFRLQWTVVARLGNVVRWGKVHCIGHAEFKTDAPTKKFPKQTAIGLKDTTGEQCSTFLGRSIRNKEASASGQ